MALFTRRRDLRPGSIVAVILLVSSLLGATQSAGVAASTASNKAQAKKFLLTLSDMPKGWKTEKGSGDNGSGSFPGAAQLASCIGVPSKLINANPPEVDSPYFENKSGSLEVQDSVSIFGSAEIGEGRVVHYGQPQYSFLHGHRHERPVQVEARRIGRERHQGGNDRRYPTGARNLPKWNNGLRRIHTRKRPRGLPHRGCRTRLLRQGEVRSATGL